MEYTPLRISTVKPLRELTFDLYILFKEQFLCYAKRGESLTEEKFQKLKIQKIAKFFITESDEVNYQNFLDILLNETISNPNEEIFLQELELLKPDIIVSFSAPLIFKERLLNLAHLGCINLHCSYLPNFAGVMPSFWTLYKKQKTTGVTVHYMDSKIDNGKILGQKEVQISPDETIFSLILKTKEVGGEVMCDVLRNINSGNMVPKDNKPENGSYFSWPTIEDFKDFKNQGGKLI